MVTVSADFETLYKQLCADLSKQGQVKDLTKEFNSMNSDESRIRFLLTLDVVRAPSVEVSSKLKCAEESSRLRTAGNATYSRPGQEAAALELYTQAVLAAPAAAKPADTLALALANRSAVLLSAGRLGPCVADMRRAVQLGYPQHLRPKLERRLEKVRQEALAKPQPELTGSLQLDGDLDEDEEERLVSGTYRGRPAPELPSVNSALPSVSEAVTVREAEDRGRYLAATRHVSPGEVLAVERPYCAVVLPEQSVGHCHHCLRWCLAPVGCLHCAEVRFCGARCRAEAWQQYHAVECPIYGQLVALDAGQMALLAARTAVVTGWERLEAAAAGRAPVSSVYRSDDYQRVRQLVGNTAARPAADLFKRALMAVLLGRLLERSSLLPAGGGELERHERRVLLAAELLGLLQSLPCNAHEVSEQVVPAEGGLAGTVSRQVGAALLPALSLTNHACDPTVFRCYHGTTAVLRALRPLAAGDELLDNYGYHYAVMPLAERHRGLRRQYFFGCSCAACQLDFPLYPHIPSGPPRALCPRCGADAVAAACGHVADVAGHVAEVARAADWLQRAVSTVLHGRAGDARDELGRLMEFLEPRVALPWRGLNDAQEAFKMCFLVDGDVCPDV